MVVGVAVLVAVVVRGPVTGVGLPYVHHPDEPHNLGVAQRMAAEGGLDPGEFVYPALNFDIQAGVMAVTHDEVIVTQTPGNSLALRPNLVLLLRWLVGVLPGLVAVAAAGGVAWSASRRWWAAGLAAGLMAFSPLELRFGPLITPDAWAGAAAGLTVLAAVTMLRSPKGWRYLLAGAAIGLAASAKYNAALVAVPLVIAHLVAWRSSDARGRWLVLAAVVSVVVFAMFNPFAVLHREEFVAGLLHESRHYQRGHAGSEGGALGFHLCWLWRGFGPALLLAPLGLLATDRRIRDAALVAVSFAVVYVGFISSFEVRFARNLLPATVALAGAGALGVVTLADLLRARSRPAVAALAVGCIALFVGPAAQTRTALGTLTDDHWASAETWLDEHVPPGSKVAVGAYGIYVDPARYDVTPVPALIRHDVAWYRDHDFAVIVASEQHFHRLLANPDRYPRAAAYQALLDQTCLLHATGPPTAQTLFLAPDDC